MNRPEDDGYEKPNYTQIPNAILDNMEDFTPVELKVLLAIARRTFGFHQRSAVLSITGMEEMTGLSRGCIINSTKQLLERKLIVKTQAGDSFSYSINVKKLPITGGKTVVHAEDSPQSMPCTTLVHAEDSPLVHAVDSHIKKEEKETLKEKRSAGKPSVDVVEAKPKEKKLDPTPRPETFKTEEFTRAWEGFVAYRKACRSYATTPYALEQCMAKLVDISKGDCLNAITTINHAIERGWRTFFPPKENQHANNFKHSYNPVSDARNHFISGAENGNTVTGEDGKPKSKYDHLVRRG